MRIVLVDDEPALLRSVARSLRFEGYTVTTADDGPAALDAIAASRPDAVVLDLMLPTLGGIEVCRRMRAAGETVPVLMLTARDAVTDRVAGLDAGADDYLAKPFAYEELLARLRALLRRTRSTSSEGPLTAGPLLVDPTGWRATASGADLTLTRQEFLLLEVLVRHPGQVLTRSALYDHVWDGDLDESSNSLEVYVGYLRRKLAAAGADGLIHTVRGVGYTLRTDRSVTR
ncbi:response regulator transcription factor [Nocardiopsis aegyptia]|uniref:Two-component system response regulator MprA n=1 Tax=Nocardiopsis aegyptia TaxID=220378 RepID=A0A7Z0JAF7_9ACTN|nr:response regulator transcription factor [Nocardiopsis aegyptia]NYJ34369.1 two-component system response regulator MprA [Nocardiopsis aegyptia]